MVKTAQETMLHAVDYKTWRDAAAELDRIEGLDEWKHEEASDDYDWRLIRSRLRQIRQLRQDGQIVKLVHHLRQGLHWNLGNIGNADLYRHTRIGTKKLIENYVAEVCDTLEMLAETEAPEFGLAEKLKFFHDVALSYGRSALMLSGGATLGLFHVGVVRALYREGVLPTVMSGSLANGWESHSGIAVQSFVADFALGAVCFGLYSSRNFERFSKNWRRTSDGELTR